LQKKLAAALELSSFLSTMDLGAMNKTSLFFRESTKAVLTDRISAAPLPYYSFKQRR